MKIKTAAAFSRMNSGSSCLHSSIKIPVIKSNLKIASLLYKKGFIRGFCRDLTTITVLLKYNEASKPIIRRITSISTGGRKVSISYKSLLKLKRNSGMLILSTSKGLLTSEEAIQKFRIGGEVICKII